MPIELEVQQDTAVPQESENALRDAVIYVLEHEQIASGAITILLTDDETLRSLNSQFRSIDSPTDVLSFPFEDEGMLPDQDQPYLGDIAISVAYASRQAQARGHDTTAELQLLAIHGVLHLLGYDHLDDEQKREMWAVQRAVLDRLGLSHVEPTEE